MRPYANIAELIDMLECDIVALTSTIATLKKEPQSLNEQIIFKYIDTRSTGKTKDYVRALNVKSERGTMYSSGDVSKLIKDGSDDISSDLLVIARKVVNIKNKNGKLR